MRLTSPETQSEYSLFSPETHLPTEERTQFRSRAEDVFGSLSRDMVPSSESSSAMLPPAPPPARATNVNIVPSRELYASLVSDKVGKRESPKPRAFGRNKRCFRSQHEIHPENFTEYTLRDTDLTDNRQNEAVALNFLQDLQGNTSPVSESECSGKEPKIRFNRREGPEKEQEVAQTSEPPKRFKHAIVQNEYVVGQTQSTSKHRSRNVAKSRDVTVHAKSRNTADKGSKPVAACYLDDDEAEED